MHAGKHGFLAVQGGTPKLLTLPLLVAADCEGRICVDPCGNAWK